MAGTIVNIPVVQFFDNNGNPLAGGEITTYLSNTTTPSPTWQDEGLTILNTNPIQLNPRGEATIWLDPDLQYTFEVRTASGSLIQTFNDIYGASPSISSLPSSAITFTPSGTGSIATNVSDELNRWVWADNYSTVQQAIDTGKNVRFTKGATYDAGAISITNESQKLFLDGATLNVTSINVDADDVVFDMGGGEIVGPLKVGQLAAPAIAGTNTITLVDASEFQIGDRVGSSYGDNISNFPFDGPTTGRTITNIVGNVLTLNANLSGTVDAPAGIFVGDYSFNVLFNTNASKRLNIKDGRVSRAQGYFLYVWRWTEPDFLTNIPSFICEDVIFENNGLDQFQFVRAKADFIRCTIGIQYDVAKQGIVYGDGAQVYLERCSMARGNFDNDFFPISDAGRSTYFREGESYIKAVDCKFDGLNKLPASAFFNDNSLHCAKWSDGGADHNGSGGAPAAAFFQEFSFARCEFVNYSRSLFSTTFATPISSLVVQRVVYDNCQISTNPFQLRIDFATGKTSTIRTFAFNNCNIFTSGVQAFAESFPNANYQALFTDCYMKLDSTNREAQNCKFIRGVVDATTDILFDSRSEAVDLTLKNSKVRPISVSPYSPVRGSFIIDNAAFTNGADGVLTAFIDLGQVAGLFGQGTGATAKSKNGSIVYDLRRFNNETFAVANFAESWASGAIYGLYGDDWLVGLGARVLGFAGGYNKSTYALKSSLSAGAAGGASSITVTTVSTPGNQPVAGDRVLIQLDDGLVHVDTIDGGYVTGNLTIPLTGTLPSAAALSNGVSFLRLVAL